MLFYVDTRKKIEIEKRQCISFCPERWNVPYRNHRACCEKLWFVRSISPNLPQMGQQIYHDMLMPLHDSIPSFMNFRRALDLLEFKNQVYISMFAAEWRWQGVWHSFSFLAWDLSMHPRKKDLIFQQITCTGACACSSNLNYAHKCIENSINV